MGPAYHKEVPWLGGPLKIPLIVGFGRGVRDDDGDDDMLKPWLATNMHFFPVLAIGGLQVDI